MKKNSIKTVVLWISLLFILGATSGLKVNAAIPKTTYPANLTGATWYWPLAGFSTQTDAYKKITSSYGERAGKYAGTHAGMDIGIATGTAVYPARTGTVSYVKTTTSGARGRYVIVNHGDKYWTLYQHLSAVNVKVGDSVGLSTVLGKVGGSGEGKENAYGAHLHFEIHYASSWKPNANGALSYANVNPCPPGYDNLLAGGTKKGTAVVSYQVLRNESIPSTLTLTGTNSIEIVQGRIGSYSYTYSSNYLVTSIIVKRDGTQVSSSVPNTKNGNVMANTSGSLSVGEHKYVITATDSYGKTVSHTVVVKVLPQPYTVSFNSNGGSAVSSITRTAGSTIGSLSTPTRTGYSFDGWYTSASGGSKISTSTTVTGNVTYYAHWTANTYDVNVMMYARGFLNQEGNTTNKNARHLGTTILKKSYDSSFTVTDGTYAATAIPRGFKQSDIFGTSGYAGVWTSYKKGQSYVRQPASNTYVEVYCEPVTYKITYNLNGGTNAASNPSTYNVLYGVTFAKPTRTGYEFTGWSNSSGQTVTGINPGANASHSSAQDLINKLSGRTIGDQVVTANWKAKRLPGDVNDDGTVSLLDLVRLCKYLAGYNVQIHEANSNVNGDSTVSLLDLVRLCKYLAGYDVELK